MANILSPRNRIIRPRGYRKPSTWFFDQAHVLNRGLTAYWPFGGNLSGSWAEREVSRNNTQTDVTVAQTQSASHHGGIASSLNGSTQWFNTKPSTIFDAIPGTWCIWIKTSSLNSGWPVFMTRGNATSTTNGVNLFIDNSTSKVRCQIKNNSGNSADITGGAVITDGLWHFIALTFTQTGTCTLYIDGVSVASATASPTWSFASSNGVTFGKTGDPFWTMFLGSVSDARIYSRLLAPSEIAWLYNEPYAGIYENNYYLSGFGSVNANVNLTGTNATAANGSFVIEVDESLNITGVSASGVTGLLSVSYDSNINISGVVASAADGTFVVHADVNVQINGVAATAVVNSFSISRSETVAIIGVAATSDIDAFTITIINNAPNFPVYTIMRDSPVPAFGGLFNDNVACEGGF